MATGRDVAASMEARVLETFRRDGIVPPELIRHIQAAAAKRDGSIVTADEVERYCREWMNARLEANEKKPKPVRHAPGDIDEAVDTLMCFSPTSKPKKWADAVELVDWAWQAGMLSKAQIAQLDALNAVYEAKAG